MDKPPQSGKRQYFPPLPYPNRFTKQPLYITPGEIYIGLICHVQCQHSVRYPFTATSSHLEVQGYQRKNESLQVLNQIIKHSQPFGISRFGDIHQGSNLGCLWV